MYAIQGKGHELKRVALQFYNSRMANILACVRQLEVEGHAHQSPAQCLNNLSEMARNA